MQQINENILKTLTWWQVIAVVIYITGNSGITNSSIERHPLTKAFQKIKNNNSISQTISKILNAHKSPLNEKDRINRNEPYVFFKVDGKGWFINEKGVEEVKKILEKGFFII